MEVLLAKPARLLRRRRARDRDRRARARAVTARRSTCATRSCTTSTWSRTCAPRARCSSRSSTRCRRGSHRDLQRARRVARRCAPRPSARPARCSTPPARWSPRCTSRWRRCCATGYEIVMIGHRGHPEVRGHHGPGRRAACTWSRRSRTWRALAVRDPRQLAYVTQTTLSVDDAARDRRRAAGALSRDPRAEDATTSATRRRTARTRSSSWRRSATW